MNIGQVVKQLRKSKKMTQLALADCIPGYDAGNLSRFESGKQNIAPDKLAAIALELGTTVAEIYARADMDNSVSDARSLYSIHKKEDKDDEFIDTEEIHKYFNGMIPVISWVTAGSWCEMAPPNNYHSFTTDEYYPCPERHSKHSFALKIVGESMSPDFIPGEIIFVDPDVEAKCGSCVVVRQNGDTEATFKKLMIEGGRKYLKALNPNWPTPIIEMLPDAVVCGVVIGSYRKRN